MMAPPDPYHLVEHLFRERAGQMITWLTRVFGPAHIDLVEEVVQDALVKALQHWPYSGVPQNPGGWLFQVARNGALDAVRRNASFRERADAIASEITRSADALAEVDAVDDLLRDDELRMILLCCHPDLTRDARVALSLKTVGGFSVQEIARAFLSTDATIAQRLVRAKRQLRASGARFEAPSGAALAARIESALEVIYLMFNEGYAARAGDDLVRVDLCNESLRLARIVAGSRLIDAPAADALVALIAFQAARLPARLDAAGEIVLLEDQDRSLWDRRLIALGFTHLERSARGREVTSFHLQAAIAAAHARAVGAAAVPWEEILGLYDRLLELSPTALVALNRVVALWKVKGAQAALEALATLEREPALKQYYLLPAVRGRLLAAVGDHAGAREAFEVAMEMPCSEPERRLLRKRGQELGARS